MSKQRIISNLLILFSGQIASWVISSLTLILVSRYLGPSRLGDLTLALSITALLGLVVGLGMDTLISRSVARHVERVGEMMSAALLIRVLLSFPAVGLLALYVQLAHLNAETASAAYVLAVATLLGQIVSAIQSMFRGTEQMTYVSVLGVVQNGLLLGSAILVIVLHRGVVAFAATFAVTQFLLALLNLRWAQGVVRLTWRITRWDARRVVVESLSFWASTLFLTFYVYIDSVILGALAGDRAVGFYAPPTRIFSVALGFSSLIGVVTLPMLSRLGLDAGGDFIRVTRKLMALLIACAVPLTIGLVAFAGPVIRIVFGGQFRPSVIVLVVLCLCLPCTFVNGQSFQVLAARDKQWLWTVLMAVMCVVNPLLNLVTIPFAVHHWHDGALGAAWALFGTEVLMFLYSVVVLRDILVHPVVARALLASLVAGAAMASVLRLTGSPWVIPGGLGGATLYGVIAIALGAVPWTDVELLWKTILRSKSAKARRGGLHEERELSR